MIFVETIVPNYIKQVPCCWLLYEEILFGQGLGNGWGNALVRLGDFTRTNIANCEANYHFTVL